MYGQSNSNFAIPSSCSWTAHSSLSNDKTWILDTVYMCMIYNCILHIYNVIKIQNFEFDYTQRKHATVLCNDTILDVGVFWRPSFLAFFTVVARSNGPDVVWPVRPSHGNVRKCFATLAAELERWKHVSTISCVLPSSIKVHRSLFAYRPALQERVRKANAAIQKRLEDNETKRCSVVPACDFWKLRSQKCGFWIALGQQKAFYCL